MKRIVFFSLLAFFVCGVAAASPKVDRFAGAHAHPRVSSHSSLDVDVDAVPVPDPQAGGSGHSVTLTWNAPVIPTGDTCVVSSYNVKRGATAGSELTIASPTSTTFVDTNVSAGQKFFYVVTAVSTVTTCTGESAPSNEVSAAIPLDTLPAPTGLAASPK